MSKPIGVVWFNGTSEIGIVMAYDDITKKPKAWISTYAGNDQKEDIQHIMNWGAKFPVQEAVTLIERLGTVLEQEIWMELKLVQNKIHQSPT